MSSKFLINRVYTFGLTAREGTQSGCQSSPHPFFDEPDGALKNNDRGEKDRRYSHAPITPFHRISFARLLVPWNQVKTSLPTYTSVQVPGIDPDRVYWGGAVPKLDRNISAVQL
ncbi:uncharacterized protein RAG0_17230 [Rhynchosporium agropyri]|uniref:Uncharacterized protein n=1 Tax=Rhynchosporium agropyri TaxID=914238 RepID=A0A1E1LTA3_9HELO|nr:uncharacterized protein RAG0_17230 [Rhynchosporium agropyri]